MSAGILLVALQVAAGSGYVQVVVDQTPITAARGGGVLVGRAPRGTILERIGDAEGFYAVRLFSGRTRYLRKAAARPVAYNPLPPLDPAVIVQLTSAMTAAQVRAEQEAPTPVGPAKRDPSERRAALLDQYQLEVMTSFELNPPVEALLPELVRTGGSR